MKTTEVIHEVKSTKVAHEEKTTEVEHGNRQDAGKCGIALSKIH